ncbi:phospholipid scramblase 1-like [Argonauta hians]
MSTVTTQPTATTTPNKEDDDRQQPPFAGFTPPPTGFSVPPGGYAPQLGGPQGGQNQWMIQPSMINNCPPGLEYLTTIDQIFLKQQVEILEVVTDFQCANKFIMLNSVGQKIYFAGEESNICARQCCKGKRGFIMHIIDNMGQEVMRVNREFKFCAGCCWFADSDVCAFDLTVEAPVGQVIGKVRQTCSFYGPKYSVTTVDDDVLFRIIGPTCVCDGPCCTEDQVFKIYDHNECEQLGAISKKYAGFVNELFTSADNFAVTFPPNLDVKMKATLIGALFLIDFMFFERAK